VDAIHPASGKDSDLNPKLAMDPSLLGPPDLKVASPNMANFGDPLAKNVTDSLEMAMAPVLAAAPVEALVPAKAAAREAERSALA